jgi:hypothetical protein
MTRARQIASDDQLCVTLPFPQFVEELPHVKESGWFMPGEAGKCGEQAPECLEAAPVGHFSRLRIFVAKMEVGNLYERRQAIGHCWASPAREIRSTQ